ncbi:hypothetical protein KAH81_09410 [bacterium]|nr:hypothetical protein [bacterium]
MKKEMLFCMCIIVFVVSVNFAQGNPIEICPTLDGFWDESIERDYTTIKDQIPLMDTYSCDELYTILSSTTTLRDRVVNTKEMFELVDDKTVAQCDSIIKCIDSAIIPFIYSKCPEFNPDNPETPIPPPRDERGSSGINLNDLNLSRWGEVAGALREIKPEIYDTVVAMQDTLANRGQFIMNLATSDHFTQNLAERRLVIIHGKAKEIDLLWETNRRWADSLLTYENVIDSLNYDILAKDIRIRELELFRVRARRSITYPNMDAFAIIHGNMAGFYENPQFMIYGADARIKSKDFFGVPLDIYARINAENAINRGLDKNFVLEIPFEPDWNWSVFSLNRLSPGIQYHSKSYYNPDVSAPYGVHPRQVTSNDVFRFAPWVLNVEGSIWQLDASIYNTQYHIGIDRIGASTASLRFRFPADTSEGRGNPRAREDGEYSRLWTVETFITFADDEAEFLPYASRNNTYFGFGASNGAHNLIYAKNIQNRMIGRPDFCLLDLFPLPIDKTLLGLYFYGGTKVYNEEFGVDFILGTKPLLVRASTYCDANSKWLTTNISPRYTHNDVVPERWAEFEFWWLRDFFPIGLEIVIPSDMAFPYEVRVSTFLNIRR